MKRLFALFFAVFLIFSLISCDDAKVENDGMLSIVVTAFPHYDFARQLTEGAEGVEIKMLISPGSEVHTYEPTPSDILAISDCDLFIYTGGESDGWAKGILGSVDNGDMKIISFMDICSVDGHEEKAHNHEHEYDEHVWTLPAMSEAICQEIARAICEIDGENEALYNENLEAYLAKLQELDTDFQSVITDAKRDSIVVADRFPFYHMATHYKLKYHTAFPGCSSSTEPSAAVVSSLSQKVKDENIPYVFTIEFSNGKIAKNVTEGTNAEILTLHSCHNVSKEDFDGGITYYDLMKRNAVNLRKALCE